MPRTRIRWLQAAMPVVLGVLVVIGAVTTFSYFVHASPDLAPPAEAAGVPPKPVQPSLAAWLADSGHPSDTDDAFGTLFSLWGASYNASGDGGACREAQDYGLRCLYRRGTWNNLRGFDLPAIVTLTGGDGTAHQLVMTHIDDSSVTLRAGSTSARFPLSEVEPLWYGEYLILWRPDIHALHSLSPGMSGSNVAWLRSQLAALQHSGDAGGSNYDAALIAAVKRFQTEQHMQADGIAGEETLVRLSAALAAPGTPLLAAGGR